MVFQMRQLLNRILLVITGTTFLYITGLLFDFVLYPFVIFKAGLSKGFMIMIILSFIDSLLLILMYDYLKKDFFAIELSKCKLDSLIAENNGSRLKRAYAWILKRSRILMFFVLSIYDPFIAVVFMRKGANQYNGLKTRDWRIFILSLCIGNGIWSVAVFTGLSVFEYVGKMAGLL